MGREEKGREPRMPSANRDEPIRVPSPASVHATASRYAVAFADRHRLAEDAARLRDARVHELNASKASALVERCRSASSRREAVLDKRTSIRHTEQLKCETRAFGRELSRRN